MTSLIINRKFNLHLIVVGIIITSEYLFTHGHSLKLSNKDVNDRIYINETSLWPNFLLYEYPQSNRYDSMTSFIFGLKFKYPNILHISSIGTSSQGRQIWSILMSSNDGPSRTRPNVRYMSGLNGNDMVGRELILQFMHELCLAYSRKNPSIVSLLRETNIYLLPMLNPDAVVRTNEHKCWNGKAEYYNNGKDINLAENLKKLLMFKVQRTFPDSSSGPINWIEPSDLEPEIVALNRFGYSQNFVISLYLEGGGLGSQYAQQYDRYLNLDNDVFDSLVSHYWKHINLTARDAPEQSRKCPSDLMIEHEEISNLTLVPSNWNLMPMLEYHYLFCGCHELLLQVNCCASINNQIDLEKVYENNRLSLLYYLEMAHQGIKGTITSAEDGSPIRGAKIFVNGRKDALFYSNYDGVFWHLLLPGEYTMYVKMDGYNPTEVEFEVNSNEVTSLNFAMDQILTSYEDREKDDDEDEIVLGRRELKTTSRNINVNILNNLRLPENSREPAVLGRRF